MKDWTSIYATIKAQVRLPELMMGSGYKLVREGQGYKAPCPWHGEKTASLHVYPDHVFCYGCSTSGDAVDVYAQLHGCTPQQAVVQLAQQLGIQLPQDTPENRQAWEDQRKDKQAVGVVYQAALHHAWHEQGAGATALAAWACSRGLSLEALKAAGVGVLPGWNTAAGALEQSGLKANGVSCGLLKVSKKGGAFDALHHCVVFPAPSKENVQTLFGRPLPGLLDDDQRGKSQRLSRDAPRPLPMAQWWTPQPGRHKTALVVEGEVDALTCAMLGLPSMAILGGAAAKSDEVAQAIERSAERAVLWPDADAAGAKAARSLALAMQGRLDIALMDGAHKDANAALLALGPEKCQALATEGIATAITWVSWEAGRIACSGADPQSAGRAVDASIVPVLATMASEMEAEGAVAAVVRALRPLGVRAESLRAARAKVRKGQASSDAPKTAPVGDEPQDDREELRLVGDVEDRCRLLLRWARAHNEPPTLFTQGRHISRRIEMQGAAALEQLGPHAIITWFSQRARFQVYKEGDWQSANLPKSHAEHLLAMEPEQWGLPPIEAVRKVPLIKADGSITTKGYDPEFHVWVDATFEDVGISGTVQRSDVDQALAVIYGELLHDFPFADHASRTHALCFALLPFVRQFIDGVTPIHLFSAPSKGSGKTLLAEALSVASQGRGRPYQLAIGLDEQETQKAITTAALDAPPIVLIDNLDDRKQLHSPVLAKALTARIWVDRMLGSNKSLTARIDWAWAMTGNNAQLSDELRRRAVLIRLEPPTSQPWQREKFKHRPLMSWAVQHHFELQRACITLVLWWIQNGMPRGPRSLGSFEAWADVVGGICASAGIGAHFLANMDQLTRQSGGDEWAEWRGLLEAWWTRYGCRPVSTGELFDICKTEELLADELGDRSDRSQRSKLGRILARRVDLVVDVWTEDPSRSASLRVRRSSQQGPGGVALFGLEAVSETSGAPLGDVYQKSTNGKTTALQSISGLPVDFVDFGDFEAGAFTPISSFFSSSMEQAPTPKKVEGGEQVSKSTPIVNAQGLPRFTGVDFQPEKSTEVSEVYEEEW